MKAAKVPRASYVEAGIAMRAMNARLREVKGNLKPVDLRVALAVIECTVSWSKTGDRVRRDQIAEAAGCNPQVAGKSLSYLHRLGVIEWVPTKVPGGGSWLSVAPEHETTVVSCLDGGHETTVVSCLDGEHETTVVSSHETAVILEHETAVVSLPRSSPRSSSEKSATTSASTSLPPTVQAPAAADEQATLTAILDAAKVPAHARPDLTATIRTALRTGFDNGHDVASFAAALAAKPVNYSGVGAGWVASEIKAIADAPPRKPEPPRDLGPRCATCGRSETVCREADSKVTAEERHPFALTDPRTMAEGIGDL